MYHSPLHKGDHPEMDGSTILDHEKTSIYQGLIGSLQWIITIGRFNVFTAVVSMSGFRIAPRQGHLDRVRRIYGYLPRMNQAKIRVRTEEPDYSGLPNFEFDWSRTVYGAVEEMISDDMPTPLGRYVTLTHFVDANLMHDLITGRSMTGILHLLNKTPIDWFAKKQATVEVATYSSEMVAMRTCVEQIIDLRTTLRYLGVPVRDKSYVFGDNESVIKVLLRFMLSFTSDITCCRFILSGKQLRLDMFISLISRALSTQLISSANIGGIQMYGQPSSHCFFMKEIRWNAEYLPSVWRGVTRFYQLLSTSILRSIHHTYEGMIWTYNLLVIVLGNTSPHMQRHVNIFELSVRRRILALSM